MEPRKQGKTIARLVTVSPRDVERFYLRILLLRVPGACSFSDLKIFNGAVYPSYREAAFARGLINDDSEWIKCMEEATLSAMPHSLRLLFCIILTQCNPSSPLTIWNRFKFDMSEDFLIQGHDQIVTEANALKCIDENVRACGMSCEQLGLPAPTLPPDESKTDDLGLKDSEELMSTQCRTERCFQQDRQLSRF